MLRKKGIERGRESRVQSSVPRISHEIIANDSDRPCEPYVCTGNFHADFPEVCHELNVTTLIPPVMLRPTRPCSPIVPPPTEKEEKVRPGKRGEDKKKAEAPPPEPEPEIAPELRGEPPPKTYVTKEASEYFKPSIQVAVDTTERQEAVSEIYIRGWKIDEMFMNVFQKCWPKLEKLHTINLWSCGLTDTTLGLLAAILPLCSQKLKYLILDNNPVKEESYHQLLKEDCPVQFLSLRYNGITDQGALLLGQALGTIHHQNQKLISLNLNGNCITDAGAEHLANGLRMNRTLLSLSLANNQIGDVGAQKFAEVISRFALTHEEIVERRRMIADKEAAEAPVVASHSRKDGKEKDLRSEGTTGTGSDRGIAGKTKGAQGKGKGKEKEAKNKDEEKHEKSGKLSKKEKEKAEAAEKKDKSKASAMATDSVSTKGKKGERSKAKKAQQAELESIELAGELVRLHPLLERAEHFDQKVLIPGNRIIISLNLARNEIGEAGVQAFLLAIPYQAMLQEVQQRAKASSLPLTTNYGLMRLCLQNNKLTESSATMQKLGVLMSSRDPIFKLKTISTTSANSSQSGKEY